MVGNQSVRRAGILYPTLPRGGGCLLAPFQRRSSCRRSPAQASCFRAPSPVRGAKSPATPVTTGCAGRRSRWGRSPSTRP